MKNFYHFRYRGLFFLIFLFLFLSVPVSGQYNYQAVQIDASKVAWGEQSGISSLTSTNEITIQEILIYQLNLLNMFPAILYSDIGMLLFYYTSPIPLYLTIGAQTGGGAFTYVTQNFYLAAATILTVVAIRFSLAQLGILPGMQWPLGEKLKIYFHYSPEPLPNPAPDYYEYDLDVNEADDDASNEYGDPTDENEPAITEEEPLPNLNSPITVQYHYGCEVPNIDLDNENNPSSPTYAGDRNACGPAAASNSLKWLEKISDDINIPISHRALLDSLSRYMGREAGKGVDIDKFIKGKLDLIKALNLPIHVKFQAQGIDSNITDSGGNTYARNDNTGDYPTWDFLKKEMADSEDVELFYKWHDGTNWRGHVVAVSGAYETENGKKYIGIKHDITQARADSNKTVQEFPEVTIDEHGRMVLHRHGARRYVAHIVSESPGDPLTNPTGLIEEGNIPNEFQLAQNYPNPFNPSTTINFSIPEETFTKLEIFNSLGEKVSTLVSEILHSGEYKYRWDAEGLSSGIYLYKLTAGRFIETKKMILLK